MIIVVRYFGGIKLGAGGLTRAYGQAAQAVMENLPISEQVTSALLCVRCDFSQEQWVRHLCLQFAGQVVEVSYSDQVKLLVEIPEQALSVFKSALDARQCGYEND